MAAKMVRLSSSALNEAVEEATEAARRLHGGRRLSQTQVLSEILQIDPKTINKMRDGKPVRLRTVDKLANNLEKLGVSADRLRSSAVSVDLDEKVDAGTQRHTYSLYLAELLADIGVGYARIQDLDEAWKSIVRASKHIDGATKEGPIGYAIGAIVRVAAAKGQAGDVEGARQSLARAYDMSGWMRSEKDRVIDLATIATTQAEIGDMPAAKLSLELALDIMDRFVSTDGPSRDFGSFWFCYVAAALATINERTSAAQCIMHAIDAARQKEDLGDSAGDLSHAAMVQVEKLGDTAGALETIREAQDAINSSDALGKYFDALGATSTLERIAIAQAKLGDSAAAGRSIALALEFAERVRRTDLRVSAIAGVALTQAKIGDVNGAMQSIGRMYDVGKKFETVHHWVWPLEDIAFVHALVGDVVRALEVAKQVELDTERVELLTEIANILAQKGQAAGAREALALALEGVHKYESSSIEGTEP